MLAVHDVIVLLQIYQEQQPLREMFADLGRGRVYSQCALVHKSNSNNYILTLILSHL